MKNISEKNITVNSNGDWFFRLDENSSGVSVPENIGVMIKDLLEKEDDRFYNKESEKFLRNVNCHMTVLYLLGIISKRDLELSSDPKACEDNKEDITYSKKSKNISNKEFILVKNNESLISLAKDSCSSGDICVGQILDSKTGELAHSFIMGVEPGYNGKFICFSKMGFKHYPFKVHELDYLLDFINKDGDKSYQNQKWRFIPIRELTSFE